MDADLHSNNVFFHNQYRMIPIIHPGKYLQSFYGPLLRRPPMCLRYAIWALAATGSTKFDEYHDVFYRRSRAYIEADMMKVSGLKVPGRSILTISGTRGCFYICSTRADLGPHSLLRGKTPAFHKVDHKRS